MTRSRDVADTQDNSGGAVAPFSSGKNWLINGGMDIWQRGTSSASTGGYFTADRWYQVAAGTTTISQDTDVPSGVPVQYSMKWVTSAASSYGQWYTAMEQLNVRALRGQKVTASAYIKSIGYTGALLLRADYSTSTDSVVSTTTFIQDGATTGTASTNWVRVTNTFTVPSDAIGLRLSLIPDTAQASGVTVKMTGVQLELGNVATPFARAGGTIGGELALCQRYYYLHASGNTQPIAIATSYSSTLSIALVQLPVTMRIAPSIVVVTASNYYVIDIAGGGPATNTLTIGAASTTSVRLDGTYSGLTAGQAGYLRTSNASASVAFSAEL